MLEDREGGCHCGRVRFRAQVDLDLLSQCNCTVCTKKGILHLPVAPENFELLRGKNSCATASRLEIGSIDHRSTAEIETAAAEARVEMLEVATGRAAADDDRVPPQHAHRSTKEATTRFTAPAYEKFELSVPERRLCATTGNPHR